MAGRAAVMQWDVPGLAWVLVSSGLEGLQAAACVRALGVSQRQGSRPPPTLLLHMPLGNHQC